MFPHRLANIISDVSAADCLLNHRPPVSGNDPSIPTVVPLPGFNHKTWIVVTH